MDGVGDPPTDDERLQHPTGHPFASWPSDGSAGDDAERDEVPAWGSATPRSPYPRRASRRHDDRVAVPRRVAGPPLVTLLAGLLLTICSVLLIVVPQDRADRAAADGPRVSATVTAVRSWTGYQDIRLTYDYGGTSYSVWRGRNDESPVLGKGDTLEVSLDPSDPGWAAASVLDPTTAMLTYAVIGMLLLGPVLTVIGAVGCGRVALARVFAVRHRRRSREPA